MAERGLMEPEVHMGSCGTDEPWETLNVAGENTELFLDAEATYSVLI